MVITHNLIDEVMEARISAYVAAPAPDTMLVEQQLRDSRFYREIVAKFACDGNLLCACEAMFSIGVEIGKVMRYEELLKINDSAG